MTRLFVHTPEQLPGHVLERHEPLYDTTLIRLLGHTKDNARVFILRHCDGTGLEHSLHSFRPVAAHTGEHNVNAPRAGVLCDGMHEHVNGRAVAADLRTPFHTHCIALPITQHTHLV